jgi:hypothetical protein
VRLHSGCALLALVSPFVWSGLGCPGLGGQDTQDQDDTHPTTLKITLYNDSCGTYIAPKLGVCPNSMAQPPHYFAEPPPVIVPGQSVTYTTDQLAGATDGSCVDYPTTFTVGIPGWGYGPTSNPDTMTYVETRFVGLIGVQFSCGDDVNLHWSNCTTGGGEGVWTSEVIPGPGNPEPTAPFGPP